MPRPTPGGFFRAAWCTGQGAFHTGPELADGSRTAALEMRLERPERLGWVDRRSSAFRGDLLRIGPAAFGHLRLAPAVCQDAQSDGFSPVCFQTIDASRDGSHRPCRFARRLARPRPPGESRQPRPGRRHAVRRARTAAGDDDPPRRSPGEGGRNGRASILDRRPRRGRPGSGDRRARYGPGHRAPAGPLASPYRALPIAKIALVAAMAGLAIFNRTRFVPDFRHDRGRALTSLHPTTCAEIATGLGALALVAVFGPSEPR